jgi:hypothetical protein
MNTGSHYYFDRMPVVPVGDGLFLSTVQGHSHGSALPADQYQHLVGAGVFGSHSLDLDDLSLAQWRNDFRGNTPGLKCGEVSPLTQAMIETARHLCSGMIWNRETGYGELDATAFFDNIMNPLSP